MVRCEPRGVAVTAQPSELVVRATTDFGPQGKIDFAISGHWNGKAAGCPRWGPVRRPPPRGDDGV